LINDHLHKKCGSYNNKYPGGNSSQRVKPAIERTMRLNRSFSVDNLKECVGVDAFVSIVRQVIKGKFIRKKRIRCPHLTNK